MTISVDPISSPRIITMPQADGDDITVQAAVNQIREWEHSLEALSYAKLLSASGKENLGGTPPTYVGITAKLENAKWKFEARAVPTVCTVSGGNFLAVDEYGDAMDVIEPSENVTAIVAQSSSAVSIAAPAEWSQTEKTQIFADIDKVEADVAKVESGVAGVKTDVAGVKGDVDNLKHNPSNPGTFNPNTDSLEALRDRGDEAWVTGTAKTSRGFKLG